MEISIFPPDPEPQHVGLALLANLHSDYPHNRVPGIELRVIKGAMSEDARNAIRKDLRRYCQRKIGSAIVYDLVERARESLAEHNVPPSEPVDTTKPLHQEMLERTQHEKATREQFHQAEAAGPKEEEEGEQRDEEGGVEQKEK